MSQLKNRNVVVFGVSADSVEAHRSFARSERLNFPLLADAAKEITRAYGVLGPDGLPRRVTFLIGPDGAIRGVDGNVDAQFTRKTGGDTGARVSRHGENLVLLLSDWKADIGARVPNFFLPSHDGATVSPLLPGRKAAVIAFLSAKEPLSRAAAYKLRALAANSVYREVAFLGIDADPDETSEDIGAFAQVHRLSFPIARDVFNEVADRFGATETPSVWVLDRQGTVVYHGALDNGREDARRTDYLKEALDAVLTGRPVPVAVTQPKGTVIRRQRQTRRG